MPKSRRKCPGGPALGLAPHRGAHQRGPVGERRLAGVGAEACGEHRGERLHPGDALPQPHEDVGEAQARAPGERGAPHAPQHLAALVEQDAEVALVLIGS
jgi:hypothetical protein